MSPLVKDILRSVLMFILMLGAGMTIYSSYLLVISNKLEPGYVTIVISYLGVWGYVVKWHFSTKPEQTV